MNKIYLVLTILLLSCVGKPQVIHSYTVIYTIESIRVDDDSEYHITAINQNSGGVISYADLSSDDYGVRIYYKNCSKATMEINLDDSCCGEYQYSKSGAMKVFLPYGYKIDTFDD